MSGDKQSSNKGHIIMCDIAEDDKDLVLVKAPIGGLILSPLVSKGRCESLYREWIEETFNKDN